LCSVKKGLVVLARMETITYKNQRGQHGSGKLFMSFKLSLLLDFLSPILDRLSLFGYLPYTNMVKHP
jgi:hypothetical protein